MTHARNFPKPMKPNCYDCQHRREIPGDCHSECRHPLISDMDRILAPVMLMARKQDLGVMKCLNVLGDQTGIKHGWFMWPLNFDPTWLITCDGFEPRKEVKNVNPSNESDSNLAVSPTNATNATNATN